MSPYIAALAASNSLRDAAADDYVQRRIFMIMRRHDGVGSKAGEAQSRLVKHLDTATLETDKRARNVEDGAHANL